MWGLEHLYMEMKTMRHMRVVYWSVVPAVRLARFLGEAFGEALPEKGTERNGEKMENEGEKRMDREMDRKDGVRKKGIERGRKREGGMAQDEFVYS